jgi:hypothetical protein
MREREVERERERLCVRESVARDKERATERDCV